MKIKNTKELRLRANDHAKHDRIKQGTYGDGNVNGHAEFKGCAIGCLSTPHRKAELREFLRGIFGGASEGWQQLEYAENDLDDFGQMKLLSKEFGICPELARSAEALFEGCDTHGAAIEFVPAFAKALPEGADIRPNAVVAFWKQQDEGGRCAYEEGCAVSDPTIKEQFLDWLKSRG